jgi:hypothetical protein
MVAGNKAEMSTQNQPSCKGFWNMCSCSACRANDSKLEKVMESAKPEKRRSILGSSIKALMRSRRIGQ